MKTETPKTIFLKDYKVPSFEISNIFLTFWLDDTQTKVNSKIEFLKTDLAGTSLFLNGEELKFLSLKIDGKPVLENQYKLSDEGIEIFNLENKKFVLEIENEINPEANKALDGLYKSGTIFCTQNEPEGFRRITYYLDRPDVMAKFTTKIIANKEEYPFLLSNGNPVDSGDLGDGKHFVTWEDPFKKPAYLYALVAGDLEEVSDSYITKSGRKLDLRIYVDKGNGKKADHAMASLKNSMKWDEEAFGLEYDLDIYMIVAVDSFNMGAMENKGLNIFNSAYVLADQKSATDHDFLGIEAVIGHEYFHNWTGNRITCRDWFQLTLKEGLTVFRDQEFSSDLNSRSVCRIDNVRILREHQFAEDAGPNAHPIKPDSFMEINNFYTSTIYNKGSEIIRMIHTLLGKEGFRKGMDKYFDLYDGQAVTTEDFLHAMSVANGSFDFEHFKRWYGQAGTPRVHFEFDQNLEKEEVIIFLTQMTLPTPGQKKKGALHIPLRYGLVDKETGEDLRTGVIELKGDKEEFVITGIDREVIPSINREFSAPINLTGNTSLDDIAFLMAHDSDDFNRFEAGQVLATDVLLNLISQIQDGVKKKIPTLYLDAFRKVLDDTSIDDAFKALCLTLPTYEALYSQQDTIDFEATFKARSYLLEYLAKDNLQKISELYESLIDDNYDLSPKSIGKRDLKNKLLSLMSKLKVKECEQMMERQFETANCMTDEIASLTCLIHSGAENSESASKKFYAKWKDQTLVMQKWLAIQASSPNDETFEKLKVLEADPIYDKTVPNLLRSLLRYFARNDEQFYHQSGRGYEYLANQIIDVDGFNPQMASGLATAFKHFAKVDDHHRGLMKAALERVLAKEGLSKNTYEIVSKTLKQ